MKETAQESAELKQRFKAHFKAHGINYPLPPELEAERQAYPLEWGEACDEFDNNL